MPSSLASWGWDTQRYELAVGYPSLELLVTEEVSELIFEAKDPPHITAQVFGKAAFADQYVHPAPVGERCSLEHLSGYDFDDRQRPTQLRVDVEPPGVSVDLGDAWLSNAGIMLLVAALCRAHTLASRS